MPTLLSTTTDTAASAAGGTGSLILMLVIMFAVMYFFMLRPENKRKKQAEEMRNNLKKGDQITTIGGIVGKIVQVTEGSIVIETSDDRVRMELAKWAVSVNNSNPPAEKKSKWGVGGKSKAEEPAKTEPAKLEEASGEEPNESEK